MFASKKTKNNLDRNPSTSENRINEGTTFVGTIRSTGFFRIDGIVEGDITSPARVVVGKKGVIKGLLHCDNADIEGKVEGELKVKEALVLRETAVINGDVITSQLSVEPGAELNGKCNMKDKIKVLQQEEEEANVRQEKKRKRS